ncbi:MAG: hypothetical protein IPL32_08025 [Chloracidobacterium sp.]|nr:hypothetical protein [Chloracidobacterium sp.]
MKTYLRVVTITISVFIGGILISGQSNSEAQLPSNNNITSNSNIESIEVLRAQRDLMSRYDQRLLDTVYYALGGLATTILVVITLGWISNFRVYKNDLNEMKRELRDEVANIKASMGDVAKTAGEQAVKASLRDIEKLKFEFLKFEAEKWERDKVYGLALGTYSEMLPLAVSILAKLHVPNTLQNMIRILRDHEFETHSFNVTDIVEKLNALPIDFAMDVEAVKTLLSENRTRKKTNV